MTFGRHVYGLGALVLGVPALIYGDFAAMGLAVPSQLPGTALLARAAAGLLVVAGLAIQARRTAPAASLLLAGFFGFWTLVLHVPHAVAAPGSWVSYEAIAETVVSALGGLLAYAATARRDPGAIRRFVPPVFGAGLMVFGVSEFVYAKFTASLVPAWLPPSQLAWTYVTGVAQIAAGLAIAGEVRARLAAVLLTAMYVGFSLLVHLPRVIADPASLGSWAENGVNLVLVGAAWLLAEALSPRAAQRRR